MTDGPKRIPEDDRLRSIPVRGDFTPDDFTAAELYKSVELEKLETTVSLLKFVETQTGAAFVLGEAGGRLNTLLSLKLIGRAEFLQLRASIKAKFDARWPDLQISDYFSEGH